MSPQTFGTHRLTYSQYCYHAVFFANLFSYRSLTLYSRLVTDTLPQQQPLVGSSAFSILLLASLFSLSSCPRWVCICICIFSCDLIFAFVFLFVFVALLLSSPRYLYLLVSAPTHSDWLTLPNLSIVFTFVSIFVLIFPLLVSPLLVFMSQMDLYLYLRLDLRISDCLCHIPPCFHVRGH